MQSLTVSCSKPYWTGATDGETNGNNADKRKQTKPQVKEGDSQSSKQMRLCLPWPAVYITVLLCVSTERLQRNIII